MIAWVSCFTLWINMRKHQWISFSLQFGQHCTGKLNVMLDGRILLSCLLDKIVEGQNSSKRSLVTTMGPARCTHSCQPKGQPVMRHKNLINQNILHCWHFAVAFCGLSLPSSHWLCLRSAIRTKQQVIVAGKVDDLKVKPCKLPGEWLEWNSLQRENSFLHSWTEIYRWVVTTEYAKCDQHFTLQRAEKQTSKQVQGLEMHPRLLSPMALLSTVLSKFWAQNWLKICLQALLSTKQVPAALLSAKQFLTQNWQNWLETCLAGLA